MPEPIICTHTNDSKTISLGNCKHKICKKCLYNYVIENISSTIKCPFPECNCKLKDYDIRLCLNEENTVKYENFSINHNCGTKLKKCYTQKCTFMYLFSEHDIFNECENCEQRNCLKCEKQHFGTCEDPTFNTDVTEINKIIQSKKRSRFAEMAVETLQGNDSGTPCLICDDFILPREGFEMVNCGDSFCKDCLNEGYMTNQTGGSVECLMCGTKLNDAEWLELCELVRFAQSCFQQTRFNFQCKFPDCTGQWDNNNAKKGFYKCPICKHINCLDCETVHKDENCAQYKISPKYEAELKIKKLIKGIKCQCGNVLVKKGGCNALHCTICRRQICLFTGLLAGENPPEGCGCTTKKPCHEDCLYGCFPD